MFFFKKKEEYLNIFKVFENAVVWVRVTGNEAVNEGSIFSISFSKPYSANAIS